MFVCFLVESQGSTSSPSVSYASVTGHASSAPQLPSVSAAVTTSSIPPLSSTLTTTAATTGITPLPSVTLSSSSAERQVITSYASVTGHASSAPQLPSVYDPGPVIYKVILENSCCIIYVNVYM